MVVLVGLVLVGVVLVWVEDAVAAWLRSVVAFLAQL